MYSNSADDSPNIALFFSLLVKKVVETLPWFERIRPNTKLLKIR
jgi:hypothetical protein